MSRLLFAFCGRVSTEDNQEPEASKARQLAQAKRILPPGAEIIEEFFDIGQSRSLPWARRPETARLLSELRAGTNTWNGIVVGEFARAFGAPIQYSTVYPLLDHFGIELWLPEVGGPVDFNSATTEMLLGMLGGTSKQERALVRTRVREGMTILAQDGNRHLGGRPPYGYLLADAGEHPNPKKRALGQRLRQLEPDPITAPVVKRIFNLYATGHGLKAIANILTAEDIPSPSAHDRERNPHRDPRGWAHSAVRTILLNEKYLGRAVWGKQVRTDELFDLDDVSAGYVTRQRWSDNKKWIYGPNNAHPALIDQTLWDKVEARFSNKTPRPRPGDRSPRATTTPYVLRGLLYCGICDRKMQGSKAHGTLRYRCVATQHRALPAYLAHHPKTVYVREDAITEALDKWLPTLADIDFLTDAQQPNEALSQRGIHLRQRIAEIDKATRNLISAIEAGTDPTAIQPRLAELRAEHDTATQQLTQHRQPDLLTKTEINALITELGGLHQILKTAPPEEKAETYQSLGLQLRYQPAEQTVIATTDLHRVLSRVGGGT